MRLHVQRYTGVKTGGLSVHKQLPMQFDWEYTRGMDKDELIRRREALRLSRPELADHVGVAAATVWRWEIRGTKRNQVMEQHLEQVLKRLERRHQRQAPGPLLSGPGAAEGE